MVRDLIEGYAGRNYSLDELLSVGQYKIPFGIPENASVFYYQNLDPKELDGEHFKDAFKYFGFPVQVSNFGRIRYKSSILKQEDNLESHSNGGWLWLNCPELKVLHHTYVYQLVTDTWLGPNPGNKKDGWYHRHHINNNGYDNRPENLIWLTPEEHSKIPKPYKIKQD